jgi:hypothetical protein
MWGQLQPMTLKPSCTDRAFMRYTVLGIDLRVDGSTTASIYTIDRVEHRISLSGADLVELGQSWGEIPVVQFNP